MTGAAKRAAVKIRKPKGALTPAQRMALLAAQRKSAQKRKGKGKSKKRGFAVSGSKFAARKALGRKKTGNAKRKAKGL